MFPLVQKAAKNVFTDNRRDTAHAVIRYNQVESAHTVCIFELDLNIEKCV